MAIFKIVSSEKKGNETAEGLTADLALVYPDWRVENVVEVNGEWQARLVQDRVSTSKREVVAGDPPPFLKKKDDEGDDSDDSDSPDDDPDSDSGDDESEDSDSDDGGDDKGGDDKSKGEKKGDPVKEVQRVIDDLTKLLTELGGKTEELQAAHDEKAQKLQDIGDTVGPDGGPPIGDGPGAEGPDEIGPTPGGPPPGAGGPGGPPPGGGIPPIPKRPGVPGGGAPVPGRPSSFGSRRTEIAHHSGVNDKGERISLVAAAAQLEQDPAFANYTLVDIKEENGKYVAKLEVK